MALGNFLAELKRRHVYRAGGAYAVVAFGLIEIVSNVAPMFDLPAWLGRALILVLIVGFPLTLFTAWMIEAKPVEGAQTHATTKLDFVLAGALVLVVGLLVYQQVAPAQKAAVSAASGEGVSIAVLPFVNLSGDPGQEFFSDGMTEEITSALANVRGLRVVGRTSAFEFKGQNKDLHTIGQALRVANLLEGSVRKEGNQVRVTAQLIKAEDGTHIWTQNYDRELKSVFVIQDDVAKAIAQALQVPLGLKAGETLVANRTADTTSYEDYLRARALYRARDLEAAIAMLEKAVAADPNYAPAWALLSQSKALIPVYLFNREGSPEEVRERFRALRESQKHAAEEALRLDPKSAAAYLSLAGVAGNFDGGQSVDQYDKALELQPDDPDVLHLYSSSVLLPLGYQRKALEMRERLRALEPFVPIYNERTAYNLIMTGDFTSALKLLEPLPASGPTAVNRGEHLAGALAHLKRYGEAADALLAMPETPLYARSEVEAAARLLRSAPGASGAGEVPLLPPRLSFVYAFIGMPQRAIESIRSHNIDGFYDGTGLLWYPAFASLRKTAEFKKLVREIKFVDYWRARGWPDKCRPVGADDFECS